MPYYDYQCSDCGAIQTIKLTIKEIEDKKSVICNQCNSMNTKRYFKPVAISSSNNIHANAEFTGCGNHCSCIGESF